MKKTYIYSANSISTQDSFEQKDFADSMLPIEDSKTLVHPNYKTFVPPIMIRRMGSITKMSVACAFKCLDEAGVEQPDAIIVGTGLGALSDTQKFLNIALTVQNTMLPPTSFIQSGHNTMGGQIALLLKNDGYNMTHVQQGLSFEHALIDAMLGISEGKQAVLAGGVEEHIQMLDTLAQRFNLDKTISSQLAQGAGFFVLGPEASKAEVELVAVSIQNTGNINQAIEQFLTDNELNSDAIDKAFIGHNLDNSKVDNLPFKTLHYTDYCGRHFSSSAFGMHVAVNHLLNKSESGAHTLVVNFNTNHQIGLTLLKRV